MIRDGNVNAGQRPVPLPENQVFTIGQILVRPMETRGFVLLHYSDSDATQDLENFRDPEDALELSRFDGAGNYRPLKTAPNLRRGWLLKLRDIEELRRALDYFYPGRLAALAAQAANRLELIPLRETLDRQTGMYRIAATISDEQIDDVVGDFCRSDGGCLRTILWKRDAEGTTPSAKLPPEKFDPVHDQAAAASNTGSVHVPLLCPEACNLLVAECRKAVKAG